MSNTKNTGGPAFPSLKTTVNKSPGVYSSEIEPGMTLRDYFAGQFLSGYAALFGGTEIPLPTPETCASLAYKYADAMLKAREQ
jgi:hypothetical protein